MTKEEAWREFHEKKAKRNYPQWPNEVMLKLFFGSYLKNAINLENNQRVLDIGCGFGQNLLPFLDKGCECYGVEIDSGICELTTLLLKDRGYDANIKVGSNTNLPFEDNFFDYLLSVNVVHYEGNEEKILAALKEYNRVLKPGGRLFLMTVGPEHTIYRRAKALGNHRYQIDNFDFRDGQTYFYFDNLKCLDFYLSKFFEDVELGRVTEDLMELPVDFLIGVGKKG